jgi:hemerythrin
MEANHDGPMQWHDGYLLGFNAMDATHREFVACVAALQTAVDDALADRLADFERHAESHFAAEAQWMQNTGFPARDCHIEEHDKVLASVKEVKQMLEQGGRLGVVRELAQALADWFPGHADYMDAALSHWMSKNAHGGAPLVLRRGVARPIHGTPHNETTVRTT